MDKKVQIVMTGDTPATLFDLLSLFNQENCQLTVAQADQLAMVLQQRHADVVVLNGLTENTWQQQLKALHQQTRPFRGCMILMFEDETPYPMVIAGSTDELSEREIEVLALVARGLTNAEIALALHVSKNTVGFHLKNIFGKLGVTNRTEATRWYFTNQSSFS